MEGNAIRSLRLMEKGSPVTDERLLADAQAGNNEALGILFSRHQEKLRLVILSIVKNAVDADDLIQIVYEKIQRKISSFDGRSSFLTWAKRIAHNTSLNFIRDRKRKKLANFEDLSSTGGYAREDDERRFDPPSGEDAIEDQVITAHNRQDIMAAIQTLSPEHQQVIKLYYLENLTIPEIAKRLDINEGTVKSRMSRAKQQLKPKLQELAA